MRTATPRYIGNAAAVVFWSAGLGPVVAIVGVLSTDYCNRGLGASAMVAAVVAVVVVVGRKEGERVLVGRAGDWRGWAGVGVWRRGRLYKRACLLLQAGDPHRRVAKDLAVWT